MFCRPTVLRTASCRRSMSSFCCIRFVRSELSAEGICSSPPHRPRQTAPRASEKLCSRSDRSLADAHGADAPSVSQTPLSCPNPAPRAENIARDASGQPSCVNISPGSDGIDRPRCTPRGTLACSSVFGWRASLGVPPLCPKPLSAAAGPFRRCHHPPHPRPPCSVVRFAEQAL